MAMTGKALAYSYIRFSTPDQLKGDSLRRQLELSEQYAKEHGLELDTTLTLRDLGLSAFHKTNVEKGALGVFLEAVAAGRISRGSFLLVESLDRLSRASVPIALNLFMEIIKAGVTIVTLADRMSYSEQGIADNWTQLIMSLAIMARAHEESATKSRRLTAVWAKKKGNAANEVVTSVVPAWLVVKDGKIVIDKPKAKTVKDIFRRIRNGMGLNLLERTLNEAGEPPIGKAARWHRSYLIKMVHNRAVIGEYQPMAGRGKARRPAGEPIAHYYPRIMTDTEFFATQRAIEDRTHKGGRKGQGIANIFSGLCKCGYCGGPARYVNKNATTKWQYLVCSDAKSGLGCRHIPWNYHEVENLILRSLAQLDIAAILKDDQAEVRKQELDSSRATLSDVKRRLQNMLTLAETAADIAEVAQRIAELKTRERELQKQVRELEGESKLPEMGKRHFEQFRRLREALDSSSGHDLIELRLRVSHELKRFIERIEFYPEGAEPWTYEMRLIGVEPSREGRFVAVVFKIGGGHVFHASGRGTLWRGPSTPERVRRAKRLLPFESTDTP